MIFLENPAAREQREGRMEDGRILLFNVQEYLKKKPFFIPLSVCTGLQIVVSEECSRAELKFPTPRWSLQRPEARVRDSPSSSNTITAAAEAHGNQDGSPARPPSVSDGKTEAAAAGWAGCPSHPSNQLAPITTPYFITLAVTMQTLQL